MTSPVFVVVGNVNQGKSSVVAALAENGTIPIDSYPGTTRRAGTYVFSVGGNELFRIVDTPGFQRPRQVLAWLQARAASAADRPRVVREFVEQQHGKAEFRDEVELLGPLLEGAGILYVVDGSSHLEPANEAEMEILRWTGQPAMALINRVRDRDHSEQWRPTLRQFFHIVREFDAHRARFADRTALLRGFREIRPEWSAAIDTAVRAMEDEWRARRERALTVLTDLMVDALGHVERKALPEGSDEAAVRTELAASYAAAQRHFEQRARAEIERIHAHQGLQRDDAQLELLQEDLFAETTWRAFGLSPRQLAVHGAGWGAALGAGIDLATGGLSFLAGTAIGAVLGAAGGFFGGQSLAQVWSQSSGLARVLSPGATGRFLGMGPVTSARYAWLLLDRALVHLLLVRERSHAARTNLATGQAPGIVKDLDRDRRAAIDDAMKAVLKGARNGSVPTDARLSLRRALAAVVEA